MILDNFSYFLLILFLFFCGINILFTIWKREEEKGKKAIYQTYCICYLGLDLFTIIKRTRFPFSRFFVRIALYDSFVVLTGLGLRQTIRLNEVTSLEIGKYLFTTSLFINHKNKNGISPIILVMGNESKRLKTIIGLQIKSV